MLRLWLPLLLAAALPCTSSAGTLILDFESYLDSELLTTQIPGITFSNTMVLSAGISLNEFELPPSSGSNVAFDQGGPIFIHFDLPLFSIGGYFTYVLPLTLEAFDGLDQSLGSVTSLFNSNLALSGDPGSSPNEWLGIVSPTGISSIRITGDLAGGSYVLDDLTFSDEPNGSVPEPSPLWLVPLGLFAISRLKLKRR